MFIQVIQGKVADPAGLQGQLDRWVEELSPGATGWLGSTGGTTDDGTYVCAVRFESEEAARRNSERPEQGAWWADTAKFFDGDVTFMDFSDVSEWLQGGSDDAGFVQVMEGQSRDPRRMRELMERYGEEIHKMRPEIIGATFALHGDDGSYVETVYFTDEAQAREHERMELPPDLAEMMSEEQSLSGDVSYLDLRQPWMASARR
jgi:hypothetical protein